MSGNGHGRTAWERPKTLAPIMLPVVALTVGLADTTTRPADSHPVRVTLQTVTGDQEGGELVAFSLDRGAAFRSKADAEARLVPPENIVRITIAEPPAIFAEQGLVFELANGDRLSGRVIAFEQDRVQVETPALGPVSVPLGAISRLSARQAEGPAQAAVDGPPATRRENDVVMLSNGDMTTGLVAAIDAEGIVLDTPAGQTRVPLDRFAVAVLVPDPDPPGDRLAARLTLLDGTRLTVSAAHWGEDRSPRGLLEASLWDERAAIPFDRIAQIEIRGGRWEWLAQLSPSAYVQTPMFRLAWPWRADRNVVGGPLRVAGKGFDHGLGVQSECTLRYALHGQYDSFVTHFGMDDDSGPYANVDVSIRVDGQSRFEQPGVVPGRLHGPIRVSLNGAQTLELHVGFGANGAIQDRFDWIEAALVRSSASPAVPAAAALHGGRRARAGG